MSRLTSNDATKLAGALSAWPRPRGTVLTIGYCPDEPPVVMAFLSVFGREGAIVFKGPLHRDSVWRALDGAAAALLKKIASRN